MRHLKVSSGIHISSDLKKTVNIDNCLKKSKSFTFFSYEGFPHVKHIIEEPDSCSCLENQKRLFTGIVQVVSFDNTKQHELKYHLKEH